MLFLQSITCTAIAFATFAVAAPKPNAKPLQVVDGIIGIDAAYLCIAPNNDSIDGKVCTDDGGAGAVTEADCTAGGGTCEWS